MKSKAPTIEKTHTLYEGRFLDYKADIYSNQDGSQGQWEYCSRKGPGVVSALVENTDHDSFVLVEQYRIPVRARTLELVAGICDKPVSKEQIIAEEIQEEVGYTADTIELIYENAPKSAGALDEIEDSFYATVSGEQGPQRLGDAEDIDVIEVPKIEIYDLLQQKQAEGVLISKGIEAIIFRLIMMGKLNLADIKK